MMIRLPESDTGADEGEATDGDDPEFDDLVELFQQRISRLKALSAAWEEFCSGLGLTASDIDKMVGLAFQGDMGPFEFMQEIFGEIPPDEEYQRECLGHMKTFWKTKLEDRYAA